MKLLREIILYIVSATVIFFLLQATVQKSVIYGSSLEPGLHDGQQILINKVVYYFYDPKRGDIIVFHSPSSPRAIPFIKRIIALPGESVEIKEGTVYIHKDSKVFPLDEPYIKDPPSYTFPLYEVPENEYFVLGDNRNNSNDSHNGWAVPRQSIIGKVWLSIWPPNEWGLVPGYPLDEQLADATSKQSSLLRVD